MRVVSDTSPILNLAAVGRAGLLGSLYGALLIPPAVHRELASLPRHHTRFAAAGRRLLRGLNRCRLMRTQAHSWRN